jgi:heme/copper-type cytochrome/quinol oxidase subunit 2
MRIVLNFNRPETGLPMSSKRLLAAVLISAVGLAFTAPASLHAEDQPSQLRYLDGKFQPPLLTLPAGTPTKLQVTNDSHQAFEFESFELHRERVVQPGQTVTVYIPALQPGTYPFFDDFNRATANGQIVAR